MPTIKDHISSNIVESRIDSHIESHHNGSPHRIRNVTLAHTHTHARTHTRDTCGYCTLFLKERRREEEAEEEDKTPSNHHCSHLDDEVLVKKGAGLDARVGGGAYCMQLCMALIQCNEVAPSSAPKL